MGTEEHACGCAMCAGMLLDDVMEQVAEGVTRYGWHVVGTRTGGGAAYAYTVGLPHSLACPELLVAGLPPKTAHGILGAAVDRIRESGPLEDGQLYERIAAGFPVKIRKGSTAFSPFRLSVANRFSGRTVPWLQIVWPDPQRRFPGDPGCDPAMAAAQDGRP